ncbi:MAG: anti-sigma factor [Pyrinomonadaceae bacterium]
MNEEQNELIFDLLTKKAVYGLDEAEQKQLDSLASETSEAEFRSLEVTVAAIGLVGATAEEPLPEHLLQKIAANADGYFGSDETVVETPWPPTYRDVEDEHERPSRSWFGLFGWLVAGAASIALVVNIGLTRFQPVEIAKVNQPVVEEPIIRTPAQMRDEMLSSTAAMIKADWAPGNVKDLKDISGDVVWSNEKQAGYLRISGLPTNDVAKETYQLWIFDKARDAKHPIDGGTFDVSANGEVIIPINAKLNSRNPEMFAITVEKPGGVVVSDQEKIAALAKVQLQTG